MNETPKLTTALFDLDGTLLDSEALILASFRHVAEVYGLKEETDDTWRQGIGRPLRVKLARVARSPDQVDALIATFREHNLTHHDELARPFPHAAEVVRTLAARGVKVGLVTSKLHRGTDWGLRLLGLEDTFGVGICADDVVHGKPDPEPVLLALSPEQRRRRSRLHRRLAPRHERRPRRRRSHRRRPLGPLRTRRADGVGSQLLARTDHGRARPALRGR